jgi:hypothetical protein
MGSEPVCPDYAPTKVLFRQMTIGFVEILTRTNHLDNNSNEEPEMRVIKPKRLCIKIRVYSGLQRMFCGYTRHKTNVRASDTALSQN